MLRFAVLLVVAATVTTKVTTKATVPLNGPLERLADFVVDLQPDGSFEISDASDDEDEEGEAEERPVLCIAPPCGIKMDDTPLSDTHRSPIPWLLRIPPP